MCPEDSCRGGQARRSAEISTDLARLYALQAPAWMVSVAGDIAEMVSSLAVGPKKRATLFFAGYPIYFMLNVGQFIQPALLI